MTGDEAIRWLAIGGLAWLDLRALGRLATRYGDAVSALAALRAGGEDLRGIAGPSRRPALAAVAARLDPDVVSADVAACGAVIARTDEPPFAQWLDPAAGWPPVVSVLGAVPDVPMVAIVGTRKATPAGIRFARRLAADLSRAGIGVVSGLAFGIDRAAHEGTLDAGGPAIAVLASGVANISPRRHTDLARRIVDGGGALVSHVPPRTEADAWRFPVRNRLIAGLAAAVVVVEAAETGGSLSTAAHAANLGRALLAVPGHPWAPQSTGTNSLIVDGAVPCRDARDVLGVMSLDPSLALGPGPQPEAGTEAAAPANELDPAAEAVLAVVDFVACDVEEVAAATPTLTTLQVLSAIGRLEAAGRVARPTPASVQRIAP